MLDTSIEKKEELKKEINAIDGEKNKVSYLATQKDNDAKLEFLQNFKERESRDKIINSLEHKVSPDLFRIVYLAQRMIKEFIKSVYSSVSEDKLETVEIIFNRTNIICDKLPENEEFEVNSKDKTIIITEKRRNSQSKVLGYVLYGYANCFSNRDSNENNKVLEEGNADIFADLVVNNYLKNHPYENLGFHLDKNYSIESKYLEENSIIRTRMYVLEQLKIDKKMLLEYLLGDKEKYIRNIFNGSPKVEEFNLNEFYEKNKFALKDINRESIYYNKNTILPLYILQEKIPNDNILQKEFSSSDIIYKAFNHERINKIDSNKLDEIVNVMQDTNKIKDDLVEWTQKELENLTNMEKRMSSANILENVLVVLKYKKLNNNIAKQVKEVIQYLINDLERNVKIEKNKELIQAINEYSNKIEIEDKNLEEDLKDSLSYLKIKLEMSEEVNITPEVFFNRLRSSLKNSIKIERNEELIAYQTIKEELNIIKK